MMFKIMPNFFNYYKKYKRKAYY